MLTLLTSKQKIESAQRLLCQTLFSQLVKRNRTYTIGYQSGNIEVPHLHANNQFWFIPNRPNPNDSSPRYWNAFGLTECLKLSTSNSISVEINIPESGENLGVAGAFAIAPDGELWLLHHGKVGGGRKGVGKSAFLDWSKFNLVPVRRSSGEEIMAIPVGRLGSPTLASDIGRFVSRVADFKSSVTSRGASEISQTDLRKVETKIKRKPATILIETTIFVRDQGVVEYVKRRAAGRCDLCGCIAPFSDSFGKPYLECHHIQWLSNNGTDTVDNTCALCPNCHRKMHVVKAAKDVVALSKKASKRLVVAQ